MKITKVTKKYFETEGERVYFFEPLDEDMTVSELQEIMNENEQFVLKELPRIRKEGRVERKYRSLRDLQGRGDNGQ